MQKVVVITRTKDRPLFLKRAITSVSGQTYDKYVHVIVNDGGESGVIDELIASFNDDIRSRIKVFHRETASHAPDTIFNEAIGYVDSGYIAIHDDDDTWHPDFLSKTIKLLDDGAAGVVVRTDKVIEEVRSNDEIIPLKQSQYLAHIRAISLYQQCAENQLTPISFIYRRSAYKDVGGYDDTLPVVGDWEFGLRFLQKFDVEYLDPGFALANYHHRKTKANAGKSTFQNHDHRTYFNLVANRYLRQELASGAMGVGYIISNIRYNQNYIARLLSKVLPKVIVNRLKRQASE